MSLDEIKQKLETLATHILTKDGYELIELNVKGHQNDVTIQIMADKASGGITIDDCAIINKSLGNAIEQEQLLPPEVFSLEIASPGLDRPLVTRRDFMRMKGQEIHFWLNAAVAGKKEAQGVLKEVEDTHLIIKSSKSSKSGKTAKTDLVLPLASIIKGILVI